MYYVKRIGHYNKFNKSTADVDTEKTERSAETLSIGFIDMVD